MAIWAIGDLQGCYDPLQRLLEKIAFDPARDRLWLCGDLVNRGMQSLETLRLVHDLRGSCTVVLGNHDLSLLAIGLRRPEEQQKVNPDLRRILFAPDRDTLLDWLRHQPLMHVDRDLGFAMLHAGILPQWSLDEARGYAAEVEERLQGPAHAKLLRNLYGDKPGWSPRLAGGDRWRAIINVFSRMRYCTPGGRIVFDVKGMPGTQPAGVYPWFSAPGRVERDLPIVCGHWSSLGLQMGMGVYALDTGCVWGGPLTALRLDGDERRIVQVPGRDAKAG